MVLQQTTAVPTDLLLEDNTALSTAQRITIGYDIQFTGVNDFDFSGDAEPITINATVGNATIGVSTSSATFDLTKSVAPYMDHGPISYLSDDTRVFKRQPGDPKMFPHVERADARRRRSQHLHNGCHQCAAQCGVASGRL